MNIEEKLEKIWKQCIRRRFDQRDKYEADCANGWMYEDRIRYNEIKARAKELLESGYIVKGGYFTTSCRGYHNSAIKYRKSKVFAKKG